MTRVVMDSRREAGDAGARLPDLSRRAVLLGASATPVIASAAPGAFPTASAPTDPTVAICERWLAVDAERQRLHIAWGDHEDWLGKTFNWYRLSSDQQRNLPEGRRLNEIVARLDVLDEEMEQLFAALPETPATNVAAVIANLTLACALIHIEDHPDAHDLIMRSVRDLKTLSRAA